jgi:hypothetical protein
MAQKSTQRAQFSERFATRETRAAPSVSTLKDLRGRAWHEICK